MKAQNSLPSGSASTVQREAAVALGPQHRGAVGDERVEVVGGDVDVDAVLDASWARGRRRSRRSPTGSRGSAPARSIPVASSWTTDRRRPPPTTPPARGSPAGPRGVSQPELVGPLRDRLLAHEDAELVALGVGERRPALLGRRARERPRRSPSSTDSALTSMWTRFFTVLGSGTWLSQTWIAAVCVARWASPSSCISRPQPSIVDQKLPLDPGVGHVDAEVLVRRERHARRVCRMLGT